jgi:hypothetical protein
VEEYRVLRRPRRFEAGHDDGVGAVQLRQRAELAHREAERGVERHGAAYAHVVRRLGLVTDLGEDRRPATERLGGHGEVEHERARQGDDDDSVGQRRSCPETIEG